LVKVQGYVDEDVKMKSKLMLSKIFSDETISALD